MPGEVTDFTEYLFLPLKKKSLECLFRNVSAGFNQMIHIFLTRHCPRRQIQYFYVREAKDKSLNFVIYVQIRTVSRNHILSQEAGFSS